MALLFAFAAPALAHDMSEMGGMGPMGEMSSGAGASQQDMSNMSPGDMDAMSHNGHDAHMGGMKNMSLHMTWSDPRPATAADKQRAQEIVATLQTALAKYKDYHVAEADGFKPFHPELKQQTVVHFTSNGRAIKALFTFDAAAPTSLLYKRTPGGGYELIGAMYTAPKRATEDQLNKRVPLSIARWHRHVNLCFPANAAAMKVADWTKFGPNGSIATEAACDAAGGSFLPHLYGWMVHVYPWETNSQEVWAH
ncbi:MAG TPA: hypothetical protein VIX59_03200 [Candidatus Binataceae bacterium]